ncbi:transposase/IS protein [compost metagenome]
MGKSQLAEALAYSAVMAGIKTRFLTAADLMMQLATALKQDRLQQYFNRAIIGPRLLVIDEIGYLPFGCEGRQICSSTWRLSATSAPASSSRAICPSVSGHPVSQRIRRLPPPCSIGRCIKPIVQIAGDSYRLKDKRNAGNIKIRN